MLDKATKEKLLEVINIVTSTLKDSAEIKQDISSIRLLLNEVEYYTENK